MSKVEPVVIKSTASGIVQHDGFTWQVKRNRFVRGEFSTAGELIDKSLDSWMEQLDDETRRTFFDTIYSLFDSTGLSNINDFGGQRLKNTEALFSAYRSLPKDKRKELVGVFRKFARSSGQAAFDYFSSLLGQGNLD